MDFKELLLEADKNHKLAAKQAQNVKRINTHFTTPAKMEKKAKQVKSEAIQKLIDEKEREKQQEREAKEKERRRKEKEKQEREKEEKRKNTFRIPKKVVSEDPPSDAESFSSISSDDEPEPKSQSGAQHDRHKSTSKEKSMHKPFTSDHSRKANGQSSSQGSSKHSSSHSSTHSSHKHYAKNGNHSHSKSEKSGHSSDKHKHSSEKSKSGSSSSKSHSSSSEKNKSHSASSHSQKTHSSSHKHHHSDKSNTASDSINNSSGYVTSPDLSSDAEEGTSSGSKSRMPSNRNRRESTGVQQEESADVPVTLTRHHLKPNIDRQGGSMSERNKMLEKLQAIRERMMAQEESQVTRKRAAHGEVKRRRAKREKLDGDFTGSCMEKICYDQEEKPSLKMPDPKPQPIKHAKENVSQKPYNKAEKHRDRRMDDRHKAKISSKSASKFNRFDAAEEKKKVKPKAVPRPPPVSFTELMKMAEQKQVEPVMVDIAPKKKKERLMTQEEIDLKQARKERLKTDEYKEWYKYGNNAKEKEQKTGDRAEDKDSQSGGFLRKPQSVVPSGGDYNHSRSSSLSIPHKTDVSKSAKAEKSVSSSGQSRQSAPQSSTSQHSMTMKPQPHPTRPGMIANKPRAMAQHMNKEKKNSDFDQHSSEQKNKAKSVSQGSSSQASRQPSSSATDKTKGGNAWDSLFSRPEYKKLKEPPASKKRKMVIDSEEEDYDDDMDDFIDDEGEEEMDSVSNVISQMFGYDRRKFRDEDDDDRDMEVGFSQVMKEEARSARIGLKEDLEDIRREQEELKQKALKKKMRR